MRIDRFGYADVDVFLELAHAEGWQCDRWEFEFLLRAFPEGCRVARRDADPLAFITAIAYEASGWIGNLVVSREQRRQGIGRILMESALAALADAGTRTVWLTASAEGKSLYERLGFVSCDTIKRWCGQGRDGERTPPAAMSWDVMRSLDLAGWGDRRESLLAAIAGRGTAAGSADGFLVTQPSDDNLVIGPWGATSREAAAPLLDGALARAGAKKRVILDVPAGNIDAAALLYSRGFAIRGSTVLMYLGSRPAYDPSRVYALASMGSVG